MGVFRFKQFDIDDADCAMKVGTDSVLLGAWTDVSGVRAALDLGAGSGLLALMVAQRAPAALIWAIESDADAARAAALNFAASPWAPRLHAITGDALAYRPEMPVDLVISNPPYFMSELRSPDARRAAARHFAAPEGASVSQTSASGAFSPFAVLDIAARVLSPEGSVALVTPADYCDDLLWHATVLHLNLWRRCLVRTVASRPSSRVLWQFARTSRPFDAAELAVRDPSAIPPPSYTPRYIELTRDFYLNF